MKVIDASALMAAERGSVTARAAIDKVLANPRDAVLPTIALLEFRSGTKVKGEWRAWLEQLQTAVRVVPLDEDAARIGGRLARHMARRGFKLHSADAAVLGCGASRGATVVLTADGDFDGITRAFGADGAPFTVERVAPK
ncbi:MAG: PIN domain-containing protein [Anaeromyxobacteraceae bacterium]